MFDSFFTLKCRARDASIGVRERRESVRRFQCGCFKKIALKDGPRMNCCAPLYPRIFDLICLYLCQGGWVYGHPHHRVRIGRSCLANSPSFPPLSAVLILGIITTLSLSFGGGVGERDSAIIWRMRERQHASPPSLLLSLSKRANWIYDDGTEARISLGRPSVPPPTNASSLGLNGGVHCISDEWALV